MDNVKEQLKKSFEKSLPKILILIIGGHSKLAKLSLLQNINLKEINPDKFAEETRFYQLKGFLAKDECEVIINKEGFSALKPPFHFKLLIPAESKTLTRLNFDDIPDSIYEIVFELTEQD